MNKIRTASWIAGLAAVSFLISRGPVAFAFTSQALVSFSASATVGSSSVGGAPSGNLALNVPTMLPGLAFFGKDVVIPVKLVGPTGSGTSGAIIAVNSASSLGTAQLGGQQVNGVTSTVGAGTGSDSLMTVSMAYAVGNTQTFINVPVAFQPVPGLTNTLAANMIIPVQNLQTLSQGGTLNYYFQIVRGTQQTKYLSNGVPFQIQFTDVMSFISPPDVIANGWVVVVPDANLTDGNTSVTFPPGALSGPGTLVVRQDNTNTLPTGPGGLAPVVAFDFTLQGMNLVREAHLALSYPAHTDGSLEGSNGNPSDLTPYWLQNGASWLVMGPREWDSNLHTVSMTSPHFSTFALFLTGATSAADLRPKQRLLTPNGDGINDTIDFSGIAASDGVHIYDLKGRRVRHLTSPNLAWDGRDDSGSVVESGIYIYQYTSNGDRVSGVILVAK